MNDRIKSNIASIVSSASQSGLVVYVGAGVSASAGLPTWDKLLGDLVKKYNIKTKQQDPLILADRLERELSANAFRVQIADALRKDSTSSLLDAVVELPTHSFLTTNYDHLLEDALKKRYGNNSTVVITDAQDIPTIGESKRYVIKLHGDIDSPGSIVITSNDYARYLEDKTKRSFHEFLLSKLTSRMVLFIGMSFKDGRIIEADNKILKDFDILRIAPYLVIAQPELIVDKVIDEADKDYEKRRQEEKDALNADFEYSCRALEARGIKLIVLDDFSEVPEFLIELSKELKKQMPLSLLPGGIETIKIELEQCKQELKTELDKKCQEYCNTIIKPQIRISCPVSNNERDFEKLIKFMTKDAERLSPGIKSSAYLLLSEHCMAQSDIIAATQYLEKVEQFITDSATKIIESTKQSVRIVRAKLLFYQGKKEEAINILKAVNNNQSLALLLFILQEEGKYEQSIELTQGRALDISWGVSLLNALIFTGDFETAEKTYIKLKEIANREELAPVEVSYAHCLMEYAYDKLNPSKATLIFDLPQEYKVIFEKALRLAEPHADATTTDDFVILANSVAISCYYHLNRMEEAAKYAVHFLKYSFPIQELVAKVFLNVSSIDKSIVQEFVSRLLEESSDKSWALIIVAQLLKDKNTAFKVLSEKIETVSRLDIDGLRGCAILLIQIADILNQAKEAEKIISNVLPSDDPLFKIIEIDKLFFAEKYQEASRLLGDLNNTINNIDTGLRFHCMERRADIYYKQKDYANAEKVLNEILNQSNLQLCSRVLLKLINIGVNTKNYGLIIDAADKFISIIPNDREVIRVRAQALFAIGALEKAKTELEILDREQPRDWQIISILAPCYIQLGMPKQAIEIIKPFCDKTLLPNILCQAVLIYMKALGIHENYKTAAKLGKQYYKDALASNPKFLFEYMELCYKAGYDKEADEVFTQINRLKKDGVIDASMLREVSIEDIKNMLTNSHEEYNTLLSQYIHGEIPRLKIILLKRDSVYFDWEFRTQKLLETASYDIRQKFYTYCSNCFYYKQNGDSNELCKYDEHIIGNSKELLMTYDALITLWNLGLIYKLEEYFNKVYLSPSLRRYLLEEKEKLEFHQLSRVNSIQKIYEYMQSGLIRSIPLENTHENRKNDFLQLCRRENLGLVDFYEEYEQNELIGIFLFGRKEIYNWLYSKAYISETINKEQKLYSTACHKHYKDFHELDNCRNLLITKSSLESFDLETLDVLINKSKSTIFMISSEVEENENEYKTINFNIKIKERQKALKDYVCNNPLFIFPQTILKTTNKTDDLLLQQLIEAVQIIDDKKIPFCADDRWIIEHIPQSFSTNILLIFLNKNNILSDKDLAFAYEKLIDWRYHFMIVPANALFIYANDYKVHLPGIKLCKIERYIADCMRDQGLPNEQPSKKLLPRKYGFIREWYLELFRLLFLACTDNSFSIPQIVELAEWVVRVLPRHLGQLPLIDELQNSRLLTVFVSEFSTISDISKIRTVFQTVYVEQFRDLAEVYYCKDIKELFGIIEQHCKDEDARARTKKAFVYKTWWEAEFPQELVNELGLGIEDGNLDSIAEYLSKKQDIEIDEIPEGPAITIKNDITEEDSYSLLMIHKFLLVDSRVSRQERIRTILVREKNYISKNAYAEISKLYADYLNDKSSVYKAAAVKIEEILLTDFTYITSLISQLLRANPATFMDDILDLDRKLREISLKSIKETVPDIIFEPSNEKFEEHLACSSKSLTPIHNFLEKTGYFWGSYQLLDFFEHQINDVDTCASLIIDEIVDSSDPFVLLNGILVMLVLRPKIKGTPKINEFFAEDVFDRYLSNILSNFDLECTGGKQKLIAMKESYRIISYYAQNFYNSWYFCEREESDEQLIAAAWYAAWKITLFIKSIAPVELLNRVQSDIFTDLYHVNRLRLAAKPNITITLKLCNTQSQFFLSNAFIAYLSYSSVTNGFRMPKTILAPRIRDMMILLIGNETLNNPCLPYAIKALQMERHPLLIFDFLTKPLWTTLSDFLCEYYGENIKALPNQIQYIIDTLKYFSVNGFFSSKNLQSFTDSHLCAYCYCLEFENKIPQQEVTDFLLENIKNRELNSTQILILTVIVWNLQKAQETTISRKFEQALLHVKNLPDSISYDLFNLIIQQMVQIFVFYNIDTLLRHFLKIGTPKIKNWQEHPLIFQVSLCPYELRNRIKEANAIITEYI